MTTPSLAPPPRETGRRAPPPPPPPVAAPRPEPRRPVAGYGRALRWSLVVSLLVHAAILLLTGPFLEVDLAERAERPAPDDRPYAGLEWVVPVPEGAEGDSPAAASPAEAVPPAQEVPTVIRARPGEPAPPRAAPPSAPAPRGAEGGRTTLDALRPGYRDPRLYVERDSLGLRAEQQSDHERYMEHVQARIDAVNDSMGVVAARERAAKDWTFRDKDGKRWGLSDEGLHLGGITIPPQLVPVPRGTGDNQTIEAGREKQRQRDEIRRQEEARERRDTLDARARETRRRGGGGGSGGG